MLRRAQQKLFSYSKRFSNSFHNYGTTAEIYFGTQTGNAHLLSEDLKYDLDNLNIKNEVVDLQNFEETSFKSKLDEDHVNIFIMACYGEGEPTDNAKNFYNWIMSKKTDDDFKKLKYTIFGLGNQACFPERYQKVSIELDNKLQELGAQRIYEFGKGDSPTLDDDFMNWKEELLTKLAKETSNEENESKIESNFNINFITSEKEKKTVFPEHYPQSATDQYNPNTLKVLVNEELIPNSIRSCKHLEFDNMNKTDLNYETGDHIGIFPQNNKKLVSRLLDRLNLSKDQKFTIEKKSQKLPFESNISEPLTVEKVFTEYFNLNHAPKPSFLNSLTKFSKDQNEIDTIQKLTKYDKESSLYSNEISKQMINVVDVLEKYPSVEIPFENLIDLLPRMYPRYYSISSSNHYNPTKIAVTVAQLKVENSMNTFYGLSSGYLNQLKPGETIQGFIRKSEFKLPKDSMKPLIFIAGGTGCAPFIGFIEERKWLKSQGVELGPALFFYGIRDSQSVMYQDYILEAYNDGIISDLFITYSHIENSFGPPMFVSEKMILESEKFWNAVKQDGTIYICGGVKGYGISVYNAIKQIYSQNTQSNQTPEEFVATMKQNKRIQEDLAD
eukprot:gene7852-12323_t